MNIFGLLLTLTMACQQPPDNHQVGLWESAANSRSGIVSIMEYKSDGSYIHSKVRRIYLKYDVKDGMLFTAKNEGGAVSYEVGRKITITSDAYRFINEDGKTEVRNRISSGNSDSIVGEYSFRIYNGRIVYQKFTKDGLMRLTIQDGMPKSGCYSINKTEFILNPNSKNPTRMPYGIDSGKLTLNFEKKTLIFNFVDENGKTHFTDNVDKIPPQYRKNIKPPAKKKKTNRSSQKFMAYFKDEWKKWPTDLSRTKMFEESKWYQEMKRKNQIRHEPVSFTRFEFVEWKGRAAHESFLPIAGMPISGIEQIADAYLDGPYETLSFRLVTPAGEEIRPLDLRRSPQANISWPHYLGASVFPDQPSQVATRGKNIDGTPFNLTYRKVFQTKSVAFEKVLGYSTFYQGKSKITADVTNYGKKGTFTIKVTDNQGFITRVEPSSLRLDKGETGKLEVDLWVPADTREDTQVIVTLVVTSDSDPNISNTAVEDTLVTIRPTITLPPDITVASTGRYTQVDIGKATATDNRGIHSITNDAPKKGFPVGATEVTWTATDTGGNQTTAVQTITVTP